MTKFIDLSGSQWKIPTFILYFQGIRFALNLLTIID